MTPLVNMLQCLHRRWTLSNGGPERDAADTLPVAKRGTAADQEAMAEMGKRQRTPRNFNPWSMSSFISFAMCTWPVFICYFAYTTPTSAVWGLFIVLLPFAGIYSSLIELIEMYPCASGQIRWVSESAPESWEPYLSYLSGWLCQLGWQTFSALTCNVFAAGLLGMMQDLVGFELRSWHTTSAAIVFAGACAVANILVPRGLAPIEVFFAIIFFLAWLPIVILLWFLGNRRSAKSAILTLNSYSGFSPTIDFLKGVATMGNYFIGYDVAAHMSEETKDAQRSIKTAIAWSFLINWVVLAFIVFPFAFCSGDASALLDTPTLQPYIQLFKNITHSTGGTAALVVCNLAPICFAAFSGQAAAARSLYAFAGSGGFVFPKWTAKIHPTKHIPQNAILSSLASTVLLSLLGLVSRSVLPIVFSLGGGALFCTYELTIVCLITYRWRRGGILNRQEGRPDTFWRRIFRQHFDKPTFLGRYGFLTNLGCAAVIPVLIVFLMWPNECPVTINNMNWAIVLLPGTVVVSIVYYGLRGKGQWVSPLTARREEERRKEQEAQQERAQRERAQKETAQEEQAREEHEQLKEPMFAVVPQTNLSR